MKNNFKNGMIVTWMGTQGNGGGWGRKECNAIHNSNCKA